MTSYSGTEKMVPISVLICTRDRPDDIVLVMPHIMKQDYPSDEVVIIDQSSDHTTEEHVKSSLWSRSATSPHTPRHRRAERRPQSGVGRSPLRDLRLYR